MVRSIWIATVVTALGCTLPVMGEPLTGQEKTITINENGKPPIQCRVLKCWKQPDGSQACQVQAIESGEIMTLGENGPATPPPGSPPNGPVATTTTPGESAKSSRIFRWGSDHKSPSGAPIAPPDAQVVGHPKPATRPGLFGRWFGTHKQQATLPVAVPRTETAPPPLVPSGLEAPTVGNYRESWGKAGPMSAVTPSKDGKQASGETRSSGRIVLTAGSPGRPDPISQPALFAGIADRSSKVGVLTSESLISKPTSAPEPVSALKPVADTTATPVPTSLPVPVVHETTPPAAGCKSCATATPSTTCASCTSASPCPTCATGTGKKRDAKPTSFFSRFTGGNEVVQGECEGCKTKHAGTQTASTSGECTTCKQGSAKKTTLFGGRKPAPVPVVEGGEVASKESRPVGLWAQMTGPVGSGHKRGFGGLPKPGDDSDVPPGIRSLVASHAKTIDGSTPVGVMVQKPDGAVEMVPVNAPTPGMPSVAVNASNAFTLGVSPAPMLQTPEYHNAWSMMASSRPLPSEYGVQTAVPNAYTLPGTGMPAGIQPALSPRMMAGAYAPPMGYYPVMMGYYPQMQQQAAPAVAVAAEPRTDPRLLAQLKASTLPSEREQAAEQLANVDWKVEPEVVRALVDAARTDPAPMVRVSCVKALTAMKANTVPVVQAVQVLRNDGDARVRQQADHSLSILLKP